MTGFIYSLIDPRDNIVKYVGKTMFTLNKRFKEHLRNSTYEKIKDIPVYVWINELKSLSLTPIIKLIEEVDCIDINIKEKYWINYYNGNELKNVICGGETYGFVNKREFSAEHRKAIGDSCRGEKHYRYNKPAHNIKSLYMFDMTNGKLINEFTSIKNATIKTGISQSSISFCLINKRNSGGGYIWIYKEDYDLNKSLLKNKIKNCIEKPSNSNKSIKIKQISLLDDNVIKLFSSIKEAARNLNCNDGCIAHACRKSKTNIYKGYKWLEEDKK